MLIVMLTDPVPAVLNWQKAFKKLLSLKSLGLSDRDLNFEDMCTTIISWAC